MTLLDAPTPAPAPAVAATPSVALATLRAQFAGGTRYLAACTSGLPMRATRDAVTADLERSARGEVDPCAYGATAEQARADFARLVGVDTNRVAIGSQASVFAALIATAVPDGGEVLCPVGEFSSIVLPFVHAGRDIRVRAVALERLADEIGPQTALVAFSIVQSATGAVADAGAIAAAARRAGALTLCDATQAVGWYPVDASAFDAVICHAYKWLCAPRGVAFATIAATLAPRLRPLFAGWYAGGDPWSSCYGSEPALAECARRFDVSPAWQAFVGAAPALAGFAAVEASTLYDYTTTLTRDFRAAIGLDEPARPSAIVTWHDPDGTDLMRLQAAGLTASGRAGRTRVAFHVFNDAESVDLAVRALSA